MERQEGEEEPLELPDGDPAGLAQAWRNTETATNWQYQHPITWGKGGAGFAQKVLWVEGGEQAERVVVGSLEELLRWRIPKDGRDMVFVLRKVGELTPSEMEDFIKCIRQRLNPRRPKRVRKS